jgi:hypothetical protein
MPIAGSRLSPTTNAMPCANGYAPVERYCSSPITSAAGRAQALAMPFGKGRVVVFGEAAMLTAQNVNFGMNYPGTDDR